LPSLSNSVTLLLHFEPCDDPLDWEVGVHGLRISFTERGRKYSSTYLPDVASEQGWGKEETVVSLMRKAGWSGSSKDWAKVGVSATRYQGMKASVDYVEWRRWRDWVERRERR
jgi:AMMECR1 domain-containing protein